MFGAKVSILALIAALSLCACFYPPVTQPPPDEQQQTVIALPFDLGWDAVNAVITQNNFHVQAQDMTNGIIEAVGPRFTTHDADCGKIKSIAGSYIAEPQADSSSVYNFLVRPRGREATLVEVRATFNSSVAVPLHPATDVDCVSHGIQESNLLREVLAEAKKTHRPEYAQPSAAPQPAAASKSPAPSTVSKDGTEPSPPSLSNGGFSLLGHAHPTLGHPDVQLPAPPSQ
jgi:hypothetical protein